MTHLGRFRAPRISLPSARMTLANVGMSTRRDAHGAGREAATTACAGLPRAPDFLLVFGTSGYRPAELLAGVREVSTAPLAGCSAEGVIAGDHSCERPRAVAVLAVCSDTLRFEAPLLPARIVLGLLLTPTYRNFTMRLRQALPLRESEPVLNRALAIVAAWGLGNAAAALPAALVVTLVSKLIGVPIFV